MKHLKQKKGFTLVEVIVVLVIVGILLAITIPSIMGYVKKAEHAKYEAAARTVNVKAMEYYEKKLVSSNQSFVNFVTEMKKELSYGQENNISSIIGDVSVENYTIFSVDFSFDNTDWDKGWGFDENKKSHELTKISVWFAPANTNQISEDSRFVVTITNDTMYYYNWNDGWNAWIDSTNYNRPTLGL